MSFIEIAFKNIKKKFRHYLIYFTSTIFSVVIFNLFCSIYYNSSFEQYRFGAGKITTLFKGTAIAVLLFAAIFVLYSGSYFIKTQKKEIAIYSLLGMQKKQIAVMMFLETFLIGMLAVICGILIGTFTAGSFTSLLMRFMAVGTEVDFAVSAQAVFVTLLAFFILFVMSGFLAYRTIYRYKLITLLSAQKQSENLPRYSVSGVLISILILSTGYAAAMRMDVNQGGFKLLLPAFLIIVLMSIGTGLFFANTVPMIVSLLKKNKIIYYRSSQFIGFSQIAFRLKANARMLSVAALLTAITITMLSATYSLYCGLEDGTRYYAPYSYIAKDITEEQRQAIEQAISDVGEVNLINENEIKLLRTNIQGADGYLISESNYLKILKDTHTEYGVCINTRSDFAGGLKDEECYYISGDVQPSACEGLIGKKIAVTIEQGGNENLISDERGEQFQIIGAGLHKYIGMMDLYQHPTLVITDQTYQAYAKLLSADTFYGFKFDHDMLSGNTVAAIDEIVPKRLEHRGFPANISYYEVYKASFRLYGPYVFIGLFVGILFVAAVGSVLYYKMMIEAQEEAPRYQILRKIGMKEKEILASVYQQLGMVYGIPFLVGLIHTAFALLTYNRMMDLIGQETPTLQNAAMVVLLFITAYGGFYLLSVRSYCRIVLE